jgi:hypothetical protein
MIGMQTPGQFFFNRKAIDSARCELSLLIKRAYRQLVASRLCEDNKTWWIRGRAQLSPTFLGRKMLGTKPTKQASSSGVL